MKCPNMLGKTIPGGGSFDERARVYLKAKAKLSRALTVPAKAEEQVALHANP